MFKNEDLKIKTLKLFPHLADLPCPLLNEKEKKKRILLKRTKDNVYIGKTTKSMSNQAT